MKYQYRLRASNEIGPGPWSPIVTVSTTRKCSINSHDVIMTYSVLSLFLGHTVTSEHLHKAVVNGDVDTVRSILDNE